MTWQWTRANASALILLGGGCFVDTGPSGGNDDDDGGSTTVVTSGGDPSGDPTASSSTEPGPTSDSSGEFDTTGSTGFWETTSRSTSGPLPPPTRIDFYPRACKSQTMWVSQDGPASCQDASDPEGEVVLLEDRGEFKRVISARPPTQEGMVRITGRFRGLSLGDYTAPVLRGQVGCNVDEKCDLALVFRIFHAETGVEDIRAGAVSDSGTPFEIDFALPNFAGLDDVEVTLESNSLVPAAEKGTASAVLWADVHIAEG